MRFRRQNRKRGFALLIVMMVVIALGILAIGFAYSMKVETELGRNASVDSELEWMGRSGVELARYVLAMSGQGPGAQPYDALNQRWAGGMGDTNGPLAELPLENYPLGRGSISVKIVDQDRKFNINSADRLILTEALSNIGVEATDIDVVVDSIMDWRDTNPDEELSGAESDYYLALDPPYFAKDGPIDDLSELLLIKGVTPALYYGGSGGAGALRPGGFTWGSLDGPAEGYSVGLKDLFCTLSSGRVNVNTAPASTLTLIPYVEETMAGNIITERAGLDGVEGTEDDTPFTSVGQVAGALGIAGIGQDPQAQQAMQLIQRYFGVRSAVFEATVEARIGNQHRTYVAMLRRGGRGQEVQLMFMYWK